MRSTPARPGLPAAENGLPPHRQREPMHRSIWLASALVLARLGVDGTAAEPPGRVLDLSCFKLTLPVDTPRRGTPDEIGPQELASFQLPPYFVATAEGDGVVFRAPCGGATTRSSKYPRTELREMRPDGSPAAWSTTDAGRHVLQITAAVTQLPPVKPHVVCAQIHDGRDDVLMIRLERGTLLVERSGHDDVVLQRGYTLGTRFDLELHAGGGQIEVRYAGAVRLTWKVERDGCYFKAGCYTQSNPQRGDDRDSYGEVVIYRLAVRHEP
jgi:hypothetical protein